MRELLYEDMPRYDTWLKVFLGGILGLTLVSGLILLFQDILGAWVMFGATLFDALLFKLVLPQRFQVFQDRVRIVLGGPLVINIPLSNIEDVRSVSSRRAFIYRGLRFATSTKGPVEIVRKKGLSLVITPAHPDMFLEQLDQALAAALSDPG